MVSIKLIGLIVGLTLGVLDGLTIGIFNGRYGEAIIYCVAISGVMTLFLFKNEIIGGDHPLKAESCKILLSNAWVFWTSSFLAGLIVSAIFSVGKISYFFISGLSIVWACLVPIVFMMFLENK